MKKYRIRYCVLIGLVFITMFVINNRFSVALFAVMAVLPMILRVLLLLFDRKLEIVAEAKRDYQKIDDVSLTLNYSQKRILLSAGILIIDVEFYSKLFDKRVEKKYIVPLKSNDGNFVFKYRFSLCGKMNVHFKSIKICDILGISSVEINKPKDLELIIYPEKVDINIFKNNHLSGYVAGSSSENNKKGADNTGISDLRDYQVGDPIKQIHWKLSLKKDTLIVRESANLINYDTLLYIDFGKERDGELIYEQQLKNVIATGQALGQALITNKINFQLVPTNEAMPVIPITSIEEYYMAISNMLSVAPYKEVGKWLEYYYEDVLEKGYGRFIYVGQKSYPPILERIAEFIDVTVVLVYDHEKKHETFEHNKLHIVTLADDELYDNTYTISI